MTPIFTVSAACAATPPRATAPRAMSETKSAFLIFRVMPSSRCMKRASDVSELVVPPAMPAVVAVARVERQRNQGAASPVARLLPDYAALHPGYEIAHSRPELGATARYSCLAPRSFMLSS